MTDPTPSPAVPPAAPTTEPSSPPLIPRGNRLRWLRGGLTTAAGALLSFLLMAHNGQLSFGVPLGILLAFVTSWGVMDLCGTFDDPAETTASSTTFGKLGRAFAEVAGGTLLFAVALACAASARIEQPWAGLLTTVTFVVMVITVFRFGVALGPWAKDETGQERPLLRRHGFWLVIASAVLLLPAMGSFSLWDPWETHYGEVSREILARDDWISTWWAQDGFFYSKPELDFWIQAIFMATLGVRYQPGQMLHGVNGAAAHPEWVVRTPIFLLTVLGIYILYKGVAKTFGRRSALLGGLILATMPDWWLLAHQTMTDMPFVAPTAAAMGLILVGAFTPEDERAKTYEIKVGKASWRLSSWHLVFGSILICAIPQIIYLLSRNLELIVHGSGPYGFHLHWDEFRTGSGMSNCGSPGNEACRTDIPAAVPSDLRGDNLDFMQMLTRAFGGYEPALQALTWIAVLGFALYLNWGERRVRRLAYLGGWFFAALAVAAKGPAGMGLPVLCGLVYVAATRRWSELVRFELVTGLCIVALVAIPWWVAMYIRHGSQFSDELIFHDLVNRAFSHVHDTNEGDDTGFRFYVWQLGYALFPWTGLVPLGIVYGLRRREGGANANQTQASILLLMWFVIAFALFSFMGTKFHHYIFPAVPPAAMLLGVALSDLLGPGPLLGEAAKSPRTMALRGGLIGLGVLLGVLGVAKALPCSLWGDKLSGPDAAPSHVLSTVLCLASVALLVAVIWPLVREAKPAGGSAEHPQRMFSAAAVSGALMLGVVARDLVIKPDGSNSPGAERILQLVTYRYDRSWPESLDFSAVLTGFGAVAVVLCLALAVRRLRAPIVVALFALSMVWTVWGTDIYMVRVAPHWGQREILAAYYADRAGPSEPVVAYQMNWKGENFYAGNQIPAFVSSGATFTTWLKQQREKGTKVVYFVTEHGRIGGLKGEVQGKNYREITDKNVNNKFVLVRAEI